MSEPTPILHLSSSRVYGGAEEHIRTLLAHLDPARVRCAVALPAGRDFERVLADMGVAIHHVGFASKWDLATFRALKRITREHGYRIIHSHNRREDLAAALVARRGAVAITTIHDRINMDQSGRRVRSLNARIYNRLLARRFARIITVSDATRRDVIAETRADPDKVVHVTNGVDLARFGRAIATHEARKRLALAQDALVVGIVARVRGTNIGKKGHRHLFEAFGRIAGEFPSAILVVVGEDQAARAYLSQIATDAGISNRVTFFGYRNDVVETICAFDILAVPSLFEGLPRALMDAMGLGKCVVASAVDGIAEIVTHDESGLLVPPSDSAALAVQLRRALSDEALRRRLAATAKSVVFERYSASRMAEKTAAVYDDVIRDAEGNA